MLERGATVGQQERWAQWCTPAIQALGRQRQEDQQFEASWVYGRFCLRNQNKIENLTQNNKKNPRGVTRYTALYSEEPQESISVSRNRHIQACPVLGGFRRGWTHRPRSISFKNMTKKRKTQREASFLTGLGHYHLEFSWAKQLCHVTAASRGRYLPDCLDAWENSHSGKTGWSVLPSLHRLQIKQPAS